MLRLIRWLIGYVCFRFSGGFAEGFVNDCFEKGYNIHNVRKEGAELYAECPLGLYQHLRSAARQNGGTLRIVERKGIVFSFISLRNRWGLFLGLLACIALISFLSGFVWNIEVVGNERLSDEQIVSFLEENGFHEGVYWKSIDKDTLENLMLASFDDCAWVHINHQGTTARVEINEAVIKPDIVDEKGASNIKAAKDGVIVKATAYDGWAVAKKGDAVAKGDLLISGIYQSETGEINHYARARGEYIAQVNEKISLTVSRTQSYKSYKGERVYKSILFFGLKIPLYIGSSEQQDSDVDEQFDYIMLNGAKLPIGVLTKTVTPYTVEERGLTDSELNSLAEEEVKRYIEREFKGCQITEQNINITLNSDSAKADGELVCLENIGEEIMIMDSEEE